MDRAIDRRNSGAATTGRFVLRFVMTYRGTYRDGIVVLDDSADLRQGETVEVRPLRASTGARTRRAAKPVARSKSAPAKPAPSRDVKAVKRPLPGFGAWKHRTDIPDSAEFARELRRKVSTRRSAR